MIEESNKEIVSIIVPVYNAESYIEHCMKCILNQTYREIEVILVNDGSTDNSADLCDAYAKYDKRIQVIHQANQGVSFAREKGIQMSTGKFITFVDIDDLIDRHFIETLYNDIIAQNADIVCCNSYEIEKDYNGKKINTLQTVTKGKRRITDMKICYEDYYLEDEMYMSVVWGKLFKKSFLVQKHFQRLRFGEDLLMMLELCTLDPVIYLDDYVGYFYIRWDMSTTKGTDPNNISRIMDSLVINSFLIDVWEKLRDDEKKLNYEQKMVSLIYSVLSLLIKEGDYTNYKKQRDVLLKYIKNAFEYKEIRLKYRISLKVYAFSEKLYWYGLKKYLK